MDRPGLLLLLSLPSFSTMAETAPAVPVAVPEPGTLGLLITAGVALYLVHRFKKTQKRR